MNSKVNNIYLVESHCLEPHANLGLEMALFKALKKNQFVLYLWQNANTVVIGRNQNVWKECNLNLMQQDQVTLARRSSGGGAVYHDLGNLCFTFLASDDIYSLDTHSEIIFKALKNFGIEAKRSGRNDYLIEEKKFSGNAFYHHHGYSYHHGTLLVDVDKEKMMRYLNVDQSKLNAKGVSSIKSRVINLQEVNAQCTIESLKENLKLATQEIFDLPLSYDFPIDERIKEEYAKEFGSDLWLYGNKYGFDFQFKDRFPWGDIQFEIKVKENRIEHCAIYSDAMDCDWIRDLSVTLEGKKFSTQAMCDVVQTMKDSLMKQDVIDLILRQDF